MASKAEFDALVARISTAAQALSAILTDLRNRLAAGGMSAEEEAAAVASLDNAIDALEALSTPEA